MEGRSVSLDELLESILRPATAFAGADVEALLGEIEADTRRFDRGVDVAIVHAARVDRLGYAFVAGYVAATRRLATAGDARERPRRITLCATEASGAHPRAIRTSLDGHRLDGQKVWSTLALEATHLLVIARAGDSGGRPVLKAVLVPKNRSGITVTAMPETPFCPEVRHATVELSNVEVAPAEVLDADAYTDILKPFRTVEDLAIQASLLAWLGASGRRLGFDPALPARACALVATARELFDARPSSHAVHVALGGLLEASAALVRDFEDGWRTAPAVDRERWERDRPLLEIAGRVRRERLRVAWAAFGVE